MAQKSPAIEARAADQRAIDIRDSQHLARVIGLHRAAIEDADRRRVSHLARARTARIWRMDVGDIRCGVGVRPVPIAQTGS